MFFFEFNIFGVLWVIFGLSFIFVPTILVVTRKPTRFQGIISIMGGIIAGAFVFYNLYYMCKNHPNRWMMGNDKNVVALLEQGRIIEGKVLLDNWYENGRPPGWMILYSFEVPNPKDGKLKIYYGSARGPKIYYSAISKGDKVSIIYSPNNPKINSEIYEFLNDPDYRWAFKKMGKLELFNKFREKYKDKFVSYPDITWWYEQSKKQ